MRRKTVTKLSLASLAVILGGGCVLMNTQTYTPVHAETQNAKEAQDQTVMIDQNTSWKYLDDNTDPAAGQDLNAWTLASFDDSVWKEAAGKFGAKRGELTEFDGFTPTVLLDQYYEEGKDTPTFFFRTTVNLENISEITSLSGTFYSDDEAAVYINGHQVFSNLSVQSDGDNLYYSGHGQGAPEEHEISLSAEECQEYLNEGENVIATAVEHGAVMRYEEEPALCGKISCERSSSRSVRIACRICPSTVRTEMPITLAISFWLISCT